MSKVTVEQFLNAGFELVEGDCIYSTKRAKVLTVRGGLDAWNNSMAGITRDFVIKSLVPRPNTGAQPVGSDCVVEVTFMDGDLYKGECGGFDWRIDKTGCDLEYIVAWIPSLEHLEQQMEKPVIKTNLTHEEFNAVKSHGVIEWQVGDKCYTDKRLFQWTFLGAMADGVNCVLQDYEAGLFIVPISELERVIDADREKAIDEMEEIYKNHKDGFRDFFGAIYDAGYRK